MTENDRKEIKTRQANLEKLKKKLNRLKLSRKRLKKYRLDHKRKLDALDEITRKRVTGKETPGPGRPQKVDIAELIEAICRIAIPGSAAHKKKRNEVIRTVKAIDQLTEAAFNCQGYDLKLLQFWDQKKLLFIQWVTKLKCQLVYRSSEETNALAYAYGISSYFA